MALIEFRNINFTYPGGSENVLSDINLSIEEGEFVLLIGPSGCGKTTLIRQLIPTISPYGKREGDITFDGQSVMEMEDIALAKTFGFVGQNPDGQTLTDKVWHELAFGMENLSLSHDVMERRIAEICEFFGIQGLIDRDVASLSGGEMQMVHLASVMVMEPEVLILDEPTAYLDPICARNFLDMIKKINTELGTTVILVEHHLEEVYGMADKVVAMKKSCIHCTGTPGEVAEMLEFKSGLPSALIIAKGVDENAEDLPLSVIEGQRWLKRFCSEYKVSSESSLVNGDSTIKKQTKQEVIRTDNVSFSYDSTNIVLEDCNLTIYEGEIFALLGGNGTGKSTLLKVLCQTLKQSFGTIEIFGRKIKGVKDAPLGFEGMVYLPQDPMALFTEITVREELMEAMSGLSVHLHDKEEKVSGMLKELGLEDFAKYHPYDLSAGQRQLLALGKLLLLQPKIILMDEPTKGLDFDRKMEIGEKILDLQKKSITILMVSHDIEFSARYATRCAIMHAGRVVAASDTREFFAGNKFFTTASSRIARRYAPDLILPEEVISFCREIV